MKEMLKIEDEYERVRELSKNIGRDFLISQKYKDDREIHVLGAFSKLLEAGGFETPKYFEKSNPPEPDFLTYRSDNVFFKKIEIVENLHWGRKRGNEKKVPLDRSKYISKKCQIRVWYNFIRNLNEKFLKFYGNDTWLVMYHNISVFHISDVGFWINIIFSMKDNIAERGLVNFSKSPYAGIFVMNSGFTELVQIDPIDKVIFSEYANYSMK